MFKVIPMARHQPPGGRGAIRRPEIIHFVGVGALVALAGAVWIAPTRGAAAQSVTFKATEFRYEPKEGSAHAGEIVFVVKNDGAIGHNFIIQDAANKKVAEVAIVDPGTTAQVRATMAPGTFAILCTLPGHREAGMVATLVVLP